MWRSKRDEEVDVETKCNAVFVESKDARLFLLVSLNFWSK